MVPFSATEGIPLCDDRVHSGAIFYPPLNFLLDVRFLQVPDIVGESSAAGVLFASGCCHGCHGVGIA